MHLTRLNLVLLSIMMDLTVSDFGPFHKKKIQDEFEAPLPKPDYYIDWHQREGIIPEFSGDGMEPTVTTADPVFILPTAGVNECDREDVCDVKSSYCVNTLKGYSCECRAGYKKIFGGSCKKTCGGMFCPPNAECDDTGERCRCSDGYIMTEGWCVAEEFIRKCYDENGGCQDICNQLPTGVSCDCSYGYQLSKDGRTCLDLDECLTEIDDCGQVCTNVPGSYTCSCLPGYSLHSDGKTCADRNECDMNNAGCQHSCVNTPGSFHCQCKEGYKVSEISPLRCTAACDPPCANEAYCLARDFCYCPAGFYGPNCTAQCYPPCQNGGTCQQWGKCSCLPGYYGKMCTEASCSPKCQNGGKCVGRNKCECTANFYGKTCERTPCNPPCANGGSCDPLFNTCKCKHGFTGPRCQKTAKLFCFPQCQNGGTCGLMNRCVCPTGFYGRRCQVSLNAVCNPQCLNGGRCVRPNKCLCPSGFSGFRCQIRSCQIQPVMVRFMRPRRKFERQPYQTTCGLFYRHTCTKFRLVTRMVYEAAYRRTFRYQC